MTFSSYDLCGPDPNPMTREEVDLLKSLTRGLEDRPIIVNIGAERGTSTLAMLEERPHAYMYSVDTGACLQEFANIRKAGIDDTNVLRLRGRSQEVGLEFYGGPIDLLFIDGDHSYQGVKDDIKVWFPHVKEGGGIIAFHDYIQEPIPAHIHGRVVYAVDEWVKDNDEIEEIAWTHRLKAFRKL